MKHFKEAFALAVSFKTAAGRRLMQIIMKKLIVGLWLLMAFTITEAQEKLPLYPNGNIPFTKTDSIMPTLTVFKPTAKSRGIAVIVCSGGSYGRRANHEEGLPACKKLTEEGITAFLLDYRIPNGHDSVPFADAQAAIRYLHEHVKVYDIRPNKVGIMGFSAGGHLVSTVVTHFKDDFGNSHSATSNRPDFAVLVYPVISLADSLTHKRSRYNLLGKTPTAEQKIRYSNELQVNANTPPVFVVAAVDDDEVKVENSLYFEAALRQHKVPVEMFLYAKGGHGFGVDNRTAQVQWTEPCIEWIKQITKK